MLVTIKYLGTDHAGSINQLEDWHLPADAVDTGTTDADGRKVYTVGAPLSGVYAVEAKVIEVVEEVVAKVKAAVKKKTVAAVDAKVDQAVDTAVADAKAEVSVVVGKVEDLVKKI